MPKKEPKSRLLNKSYFFHYEKEVLRATTSYFTLAGSHKTSIANTEVAPDITSPTIASISTPKNITNNSKPYKQSGDDKTRSSFTYHTEEYDSEIEVNPDEADDEYKSGDHYIVSKNIFSTGQHCKARELLISRAYTTSSHSFLNKEEKEGKEDIEEYSDLLTANDFDFTHSATPNSNPIYSASNKLLLSPINEEGDAHTEPTGAPSWDVMRAEDDFVRKTNCIHATDKCARFISRLHGPSCLFAWRAIVTKKPGCKYSDIVIDDFKTAIKLFLATTREIQRIHKKSFVLIKVSTNKFLYDMENDQTTYLPGRYALRTNEPIPDYYVDDPELDGITAPELKTSTIATPLMDIYGLGFMMKNMCSHLFADEKQRNNALYKLLDICLADNIDERPGLSTIERNLTRLFSRMNEPSMAATVTPKQ